MSKEEEKIHELLTALLMMYEQYCSDGHHFMSAGECASEVLERYGYATFDGAGGIEKILYDQYDQA